MEIEKILAQVYQNRQIQLDPYIYTTDAMVFAAAASTVTTNINIQADSDFVIMQGAYFVNVAAAVQTRATQNLFNGTVVLTDSGSGRQLMNAPVPVDSLFGNGQFPFVWPWAKLLASKATFQVQVNQIQATAQSLYLQFIGFKIFVLG